MWTLKSFGIEGNLTVSGSGLVDDVPYSIASTVTVSDMFHIPKACPNYWGL